MKYINQHPLLERTLQEVKADLRKFQSDSDIAISLDEVLLSVEATRVSLPDVLPGVNANNNIDKLPDDKEFGRMLRSRHLRCGEVMDTEDHATLATEPFKSLMVYQQDSTDLDTPLYLLVQRKKGDLELYYVQDDIAHFFNSLTSLRVTIKHANGDSWEYTTSNSGEDWTLDKGTADELCKKELDWQDIENLGVSTGFSVFFD